MNTERIKKPLSVLQIVATPAVGGVQEIVCHLIKDQLRHGIAVTAATSPGGPLISKLNKLGVETLQVDMKRGMRLTTLAALCRFMTRNRVDIAHAHGTRATLYTYLASRLHKTTRVIGHVHLFNNWRYNRSWEALLDRIVSNRINRVVACSDLLRTSLIDQQGLSPYSTIAIPNGIDLGRFRIIPARADARSRLGLPTQALIAGTCTRLVRVKGISYLIETMALLAHRLPNLQLAIAGDGKLKAELQRQAANAGLFDRIHWLGYRSDIPSVLAALDLFVLPSLVEGLPLVVLEAMAARVPVIATAVSGTPEVVLPRQTGLLVEPASAPALAEAIVEIADNPSLGCDLAATAYRMVNEYYTAEVMAEKVRTLYAGLCPASQLYDDS